MIDGFDTPSFDVDLTAFLSKAGTFVPESSLDTVFANLTNLLKEVASYAPELNAGETPTSLSGMFDIMNQVSEFGSALGGFLELVDDGESCARAKDPTMISILHSSHIYYCEIPSSN